MQLKNTCVAICLHFFCYNCVLGQTLTNFDCVSDSTFVANIVQYLETKYVPGKVTNNNEILSYLNNKSSQFCSILIYARLFDKICTEGLDLNYQVSPVTRLSYIASELSFEDSIHINQVMANNLRYYCFRDFVYLKNHYEQHIIEVYFKENISIDFEKTINTLISYGGFSHPIMVKNFLLSKYDKFSLEKFSKDLEESLNGYKVIVPNANGEYGEH